MNSQTRINKISEKLNGINLKLTKERVMKVEHAENRFKTLESKFTHFKETSHSRQT
jgi:hypothetical protein